MDNQIRSGYYRVSVKALVFDESRTKFLITQEERGWWDLPSGGLDWEEDPHTGLRREIDEEMGLLCDFIKEEPSYFFTFVKEKPDKAGLYCANVLYETTLVNLDFAPSPECVAIRFVNAEEAKKLELIPNFTKFLGIFDPKNH